MIYIRLLLITTLSFLVLSMGDPTFLPGNPVEEPEAASLKNLKQVDEALIQMEEEETKDNQRRRNERINSKNFKSRTPSN